MKVIILGAGQVGASVAEGLVSEENDITVVDSDGARLMRLQDKLDLRAVVGNAATPSVLRQAGAEDADAAFDLLQERYCGALLDAQYADIGISLPGTGEAPTAPVYIDGEKALTLRGEHIAQEFQRIVLDYVQQRYGKN